MPLTVRSVLSSCLAWALIVAGLILLTSCAPVRDTARQVNNPKFYRSNCHYAWFVWTLPPTQDVSRLEATLEVVFKYGTAEVEPLDQFTATGSVIWVLPLWRYPYATIKSGSVLDTLTGTKYPFEGLPQRTAVCHYLPMILKEESQ